MSADERPLSGLLGRGATYEGELTFEGRVRLDGTFKGKLTTDDTLEIGEGGRVDTAAAVEAARTRARRRLIIEATGRVIGAVDATSLEVMPGARLSAMVQVGDASAPKPIEAPKETRP